MTEVLPKLPVMDARGRSGVVNSFSGRDSGTSNGKDGPLTNDKPSSKSKIPNSPTTQTDDAQIGGSNDGEESSRAIDPLSQQILKRTNTVPTTIPKLRSQPTDPVYNQSATNESNVNKKLSGETAREVGGSSKGDKKKVSFLSRIIGTNKKNFPDLPSDNASEADGARTEGMDAQPYVDNFGFSPKIPQPPAYIKVRAKFKGEKQFDRLFLAQELLSGADKNSPPVVGSNPAPQSGSAATQNPIWATEFSRDGKYLAAGGQDRVVRVWAVIASPEDRHAHEQEESDSGRSEGEPNRLSSPVFHQKTFREYHGHTATILDLSWSKNNFLLSSSMDKTVRLWHVSRDETLCTFKHSDFVPSVQFHPTDDRFFLAGSLDAKLRLWSIPDKSVAYSTSTVDMITAVSFTPDGKTCIAGTLGGMCMFYDTEGLKWQAQLHVKSTRGQNAKGSKITGIQTAKWPPDSPHGAVKMLVSSNDSRLRVYNIRDKNLEMKFKGHENNCSQIRATFAESSGHIICGSEDRKTYIWSTSAPEGEKRNAMPVEMFEAHNSITTCTVIAPTSTKQLLSNSEDPIFDLCNPPPVTLVSRAESVISSRAPTDAGQGATDSASKKATANPAYIARSAHRGGNIIVTADYTGALKVFRQDCAFAKRIRMSEQWESSSLRRTSSKPNRASSILSRGSRSRGDSISTQPPNDRIMTWRQDVTHGSFDSGSSFRAGSPRKAMTGFSSNSKRASYSSTLASTTNVKSTETSKPSASKDLSHSSPGGSQSDYLSPPHSKQSSSTTSQADKLFARKQSEGNPLAVYNGQSWLFWRDKGTLSITNNHPSRPEYNKRLSGLSDVSKLTSELNDEEGVHTDDDDDDEDEGGKKGGEDGTGIQCGRCGSEEFKVQAQAQGHGDDDDKALVCVGCGKIFE